jgi:hypothetical protein
MCTRSIIQFPTSTTAESLLLGNGGEGNKQPDNMQAKEEIKDILYPFLKKRETGWACVLRKDFSRPPE